MAGGVHVAVPRGIAKRLHPKCSVYKLVAYCCCYHSYFPALFLTSGHCHLQRDVLILLFNTLLLSL
jgi:hypothetical protein